MAAQTLSPRAQRTYRALVDAGLELLAERPIDALAIDEIVGRAGVAKGSFFNHFADKAAFGQAVGAEIRVELEARIGAANAGVADPLARLAGGMRTGLAFALDEPRKTAIMLRNASNSTLRDQPLNQGVAADLNAAVATGRLRKEAQQSGVRFWLGLCQVLMANAIERRIDRTEAARRLEEMLVLALTGLGLSAKDAAGYASASAELLRLGR
ncbi:TetR/AcrR family transcriptional regulator [Novosphingobium ginsenosidimutans]|uniref:TetR/AcrR family transcriptional regulator n=1 Tax=Novosphingobium ginsenosidimutans TaxID=1176536 RepID=A0A5B8S3L8_9SPHN|nr:TetR/AcrR family transcriptional regulator [Novosphingobium ginsenosidimutans]QEA16031.1 TetR/AcrR family transcriptional regulator [Novosphingobium ginsenosidimutans]